MMPNHEHTLYGTTTIGEKGQAVIPADARKKMRLKKGEKLLVFGVGDDMVVLAKVSGIAAFASHLKEQLKNLDRVITSTK